ncbi:hypothetical protein EST38_g11042 [Candolleomyces aberdarensis]|uniref:Uncharacterized protein n=1 Tax=Candolleomyces aberdarensis TaxID=2316362 RepID=A0A4Q2D6K0_9AGAR|nr:hypothetical protein EST38_g11042 [Candolleomyces aberdarensis]
MKPEEARNALPELWLQKLCSNLSGAQSIEDVQAVLDGLGASWLSDNQVESALRQLLDATEHKQLIELVLGYGSWSRRLSAWLLKSFPKYSADEFQTFIHSEILERLSHFLLFVPCAIDRERQLFLSEAKFRVEKIPHVLKYMVDLALDKTEVVDVDEADSDGFVTAKKRKQFQQTRVHKVERLNSSLEQQDLSRLNVTYPRTKKEAFFNASLLSDVLKWTLSRYLGILQEPEIYSAIQNMVVVLVSANREERSQQPGNGSVSEEAPADTTPAAYPCVQPMTAALYFESASVFGDWRILISKRANRDLRDARRSDAKFFQIVMKKIIELSNGHFSDDNQKRLNGPNVGLPVFEAKMTRDTRLVVRLILVMIYLSLSHFGDSIKLTVFPSTMTTLSARSSEFLVSIPMHRSTSASGIQWAISF